MNAPVPSTEIRSPLMVGGRIAPIIPQSMEDAYRLGTAIVKAGMAPRGMETPEKCMVAILRGLEVGLTPMQAVDKIAVVNGRPTIWGDGAMALVRGSGLCEFVNERIDGEGDARVAVCETKRKGEREPIRRTFSVSEAKEAGLWNKQGPWKQFPARMLQMRARAFALRDLYADVLGGLYLREEIEEDRAERARQDTPPPATPRRQVEQQPAAPMIEHRADEAPAAVAHVSDHEREQIAATEQTAEDVVSKESLLAELGDRLGYAATRDDVEEAYTDFDAEALLSDYPGGVEAARDLKAKHLDRVGQGGGPQQAAPSDLPGDEAIQALARDPFAIPADFKGGRQYRIFIRDAAAAAKSPEDAERLRAIWADTKPQRAELATAGQIDNVVVKLLLDDLKAALDRIKAAHPETYADEAPPPAAPRRERQDHPAQEPGPAQAPVEDPVAAYSAKQDAALAAARSKQDVERFWLSACDERDECGASDGQRLAWKSAMQRRKADLPDAEG